MRWNSLPRSTCASRCMTGAMMRRKFSAPRPSIRMKTLAEPFWTFQPGHGSRPGTRLRSGGCPRLWSTSSTMMTQERRLASRGSEKRDVPMRRLRRLGNQPGAEAARAHADVLAHPVDHRVDPLEVRALRGLGLDVGVGDVVSHQTLLGADFTLVSHGRLLGR